MFLYSEVLCSPEIKDAGILDYGFLDIKDAIRILQDRTNHKNDEIVENFLLTRHEKRPVMEKVVSRISELKEAGYKIFLLSNCEPLMINRLKTASNVFDKIDGAILSFEVHQVKPYHGIFNTLLERYSLNADESVFIDDNAKYISVANRLGFHAFQSFANSENSVLQAIDKALMLDEQ